MGSGLAALAALSAAGLGACGGGGGGGGPSGIFLDSPVSGLTYETAGGSTGMTDVNGRFRYSNGQTVTFSIGDVVLGVAQGAAVVTPVELVPGAVDETDDTVINIARFLQTLDLDQDPTNGIELDEVVRMAAVGVTVDFEQAVADFEANEQAKVDTLTAGLAGGSRTLVPAADAEDHLGDTLRMAVAGRYDGRFTGDDSGPFHVFVDRAGTLYGWAVSATDGAISLEGSVSTDGGFAAGNAGTGAIFMGTIDRDGTFSGTWLLSPDSGTFQGTRTIDLDTALDQALIDSLAGTYTGTSTSNQGTDSFTATFDSMGNMSLAAPSAALAGCIISTDVDRASFAALDEEGAEIHGTVSASGTIQGTFDNRVTGEHGFFNGTRL